MICVSLLSYIRGKNSDLSADMEHLVDRVAYASCSETAKHFLSYMFFVQDFTKEQADYFYDGDSAPVLNELVENQAFFDVDYATGKYHFHTIFRDCIAHHFKKLKLSEQCVRYEKIADYFLGQQNYYQALVWYEKAGNYEGVLHTLEQFQTVCSAEEDRELMIRCYDHCPKPLFEDYPLCLVLFMWRFYNYGEKQKQKECEEYFEQIMGQIMLAKEDKDYLWKAYYVFLSQSSFNDFTTMRYYLKKAIELEGDNLPKIDLDVPRTFGIPSVFHMFYSGGNGREMADELISYLRECGESGICSYSGICELIEAEHSFYTGDVDAAEVQIQKALRLCMRSGLTCYVINALHISAHVAYYKGDYKRVKKIVSEMRSMVIRERGEKSGLTYTVDMCDTFFHENIGYPTVIAEWLTNGDKLPQEVMPQAYPYAVMIRIENSIRSNKYVEILSAEDEILEMISEYPNSMTIGSIYLLLACAKNAMSNKKEAKAYIKKAVRQMGFHPVIVYARYGQHLVEPFQELAEENESYRPIIEACRKYYNLNKSAKNPHYEDIFPMLTKRENDVALLAVDGFTNKQIAAQLFISENTVKSSLKNIFTKLGIDSRRELLRVAQMGTKF